MAMSDCAKCWETPCVCGHNYRDWSIGKLEAQLSMLGNVLAEKRSETQAIFSDSRIEHELSKIGIGPGDSRIEKARKIIGRGFPVWRVAQHFNMSPSLIDRLGGPPVPK